MILFVWNVFQSWHYGEPVTVDDPRGYGNSLEWATSCPPPRHNFTELARIRSLLPQECGGLNRASTPSGGRRRQPDPGEFGAAASAS
jgi:heme/copper-type cytochrome/quinol oxidase subunit 1